MGQVARRRRQQQGAFFFSPLLFFSFLPLQHPQARTYADAHARQIRWIADTHGAFTKALDLTFDATPLLGNERSRRYAMLVEDGKVKSVHVEPDNIGINESTVDKVLAHL